MTGSESFSFVTSSYLEAKALWQGRSLSRDAKRRLSNSKETSSKPFHSGRDPKSLKEVLTRSAEDLGWSVELSQARVIAEWEDIVGSRIAAHTEVVGIQDGVLQVQSDSTAWATELRRLREHITTKIIEAFPSADISDVRVLAPGAPSWRHGRRIVRGGRGPRDTYG
ncbi:MAG: DUF721 domain-containing protein [Canibacter sp.]